VSAPAKRRLLPCGTYAAYYRHRKNKEEPCEACKEAHRQYMRRHKGVVNPRGPRARPIGVRPPCGTQYAYKLHVIHHESCETCREATRLRSKEAYYKRLKRKPSWRVKASAASIAAVRALCSTQPDGDLLMDILGVLDLEAPMPVLLDSEVNRMARILAGRVP
jgi:hypothetical protein